MTQIPPLPVLLLPGMDGTGRLFAGFAERLHAPISPIVVSYPFDPTMRYADYVDALPVPEGPFAIVAESFSGPIAVMLAARLGARVRALVLAATFVREPLVGPVALAAHLPAIAYAKPPPAWALRIGMLERRTPIEEVRAIARVIDSVPGDVIRARMRLIQKVDVSEALAGLTTPTLYLHATRDRLVGRRALAAVRRAKPDVTVIDVHAPHLMLQCAPDVCAAHVAEFVLAAAR